MALDIEMKKLREIMQAMVRYDLSSVKITENESSVILERTSEKQRMRGSQALVSVVDGARTVSPGVLHAEAVNAGNCPPMPSELVADAKTTLESPDDCLTAIESPIIGTFYSASKPGAEPYVLKGQKIQKGDIIGIIEAMKVMNEVKATTSGSVEEIFVADRSLVEYGTVLMNVRP